MFAVLPTQSYPEVAYIFSLSTTMPLTPRQRRGNPSELPYSDLPEIHISINPEGEHIGDGAPRAAPHDEDSNSLEWFQLEANG